MCVEERVCGGEMCGGEGYVKRGCVCVKERVCVWRYKIESSMGGRWKERRRREGVLADKFTSHGRLPCSHVHCSSVVNEILSPAAVLKLCPPGVSMVISSGVVMEKGGRRN